MAKYLVIVESPTKIKTIKKILGANFTVMASYGHVRDMPKSQLGIGPENDFEPKYITIRGKGDVLADLRKAVKKVEKIYLATDPDREGEAISWHLSKALNLEDKKYYRITFNEITKNAVENSLKNARSIDINLVNEQQARRVLDRIVGYKISPLLWEKVKSGLSAGRVQSAALRIIGDRENEINEFIPEEYWSLEGEFILEGEQSPLVAKFYGNKDKSQTIGSVDEMEKIIYDLKDATYVVDEVKKSERMRKSPLPFTTSTLQQEAAKELNFSIQKTMRLAQQLYEGIEMKGQGTVGIITYLRTDSTRISEEAEAMAKEYIVAQYGEVYLSNREKKADGKNKIQDAHEAIRPTNVNWHPADLKEFLSRDQYRLYQLIWKRFLASCMNQAVYTVTSVKISGADYYFTVSASIVKFDGYRVVYEDEKNENKVISKEVNQGTELVLRQFNKQQHFTQPPVHYTEATLVKTLEELGIGRPSTYVPIITTIINRRYVVKENKNLYMTEIGEIVNDIMKKSFPRIVDNNFTANLEGLLDYVGEGTLDWKSIIRNYFHEIEKDLAVAENELEKVKIEDEVTDVVCDKCGKNMVIKYGPYGRFLACPGFPECRNTKLYVEKIGVLCPQCGKDVVARMSKKGRRYYSCENNPDCDFMSWQRPVNEKCSICGKHMVEKGKKLACSDRTCKGMNDR